MLKFVPIINTSPIFISVMGRSLSYEGYRFLCKMVKTYKTFKKKKKSQLTTSKSINGYRGIKHQRVLCSPWFLIIV